MRRNNSLEIATLVLSIGVTIAAGFAAWYTHKQAEISQDVGQRQLRAYVGLRAVNVRDGRVELRFVNRGNTPALELATWTGWSFDKEVAKAAVVALEHKHAPTSHSIAWQGSDNFVYPVPENIDSKRCSRLFVYGLFRYKDVFGVTQRTYFNLGGHWNGQAWTFESWDQGNEAT